MASSRDATPKKSLDDCSGYISEFNMEIIRRMDAMEANQRRAEDKADARLERIEEIVTTMHTEQQEAVKIKAKADEDCRKADEANTKEISELKKTVEGHTKILDIGGKVITAIWGVTLMVIGWVYISK